MKPIRLIVADDHPLFRRGLVSLLNDMPDTEVVGEAATASEAIELANQLQPDVVLMDVIMPGGGVEATRIISQTMPQVKVLMLTVSEDKQNLLKAIKAGASGYLLKEAKSEDIVEAIHQIYSGQAVLAPAVTVKVLQHVRQEALDDLTSPKPVEGPISADTSLLTPRELEIFYLVAEGLTNLEIGRRLALAENTVKNHIRNMLRKTPVRNRAGLVVWGIQVGLIENKPNPKE